MLHILLIILKIIGIILAVILGILVLLVCIVFFVPIIYSVEAECDNSPESIRGIVKVTWLLRLVEASIKYEGREIKTDYRIAWKKSGKEVEEKEVEKNEESFEKKPVEKKPVEKMEKMEPELQPQSENVKKESEEGSCQPERTEEKRQENCQNDEEKHSNAEKTDENLEKEDEKVKKDRPKIRALSKKIMQGVEKLKCTFRSFCDKIKTLLEKKEKLSAFIKDETHTAAFSKLKKECLKLLRRVKPGKLIADVQYGFDDPCLTGKVLAGLGMLYPFMGSHVQITPDFEQRVLRGNLKARGKVYVVHLAALLWNLFWCREIRVSYKDIRNFKL